MGQNSRINESVRGQVGSQRQCCLSISKLPTEANGQLGVTRTATDRIPRMTLCLRDAWMQRRRRKGRESPVLRGTEAERHTCWQNIL